MKVIRTVMALALMVIGYSCCKDDDVIPPDFLFQIEGDGITRTFNQDSDFKNVQLNLRQDVEYKFLLAGSDLGGLEQVMMSYESSHIVVEANITENWILMNPEGNDQSLYWYDDTFSYYPEIQIDGTLITRGNNQESSIGFYLKDMVQGAECWNITSVDLKVFIGNHTTETKFN